MNSYRKKLLIISIIFTAVGIINLVLFAVLSSLKIVGYRDLSYVFVFGFIATVWIPVILNFILKLKFNMVLLISYNVFMFLSISCGSLWGLYTLIPGFDKFVHFVSGVLFALLGYDLFKNGKINRASLVWIFLISFSISMMAGGVWEIYEFSSDILIGNNAQGTLDKIGREAIMDTMFDIVSDFAGAFLGAGVCVLIERFSIKNSNVLLLNEQADDKIK